MCFWAQNSASRRTRPPRAARRAAQLLKLCHPASGKAAAGRRAAIQVTDQLHHLYRPALGDPRQPHAADVREHAHESRRPSSPPRPPSSPSATGPIACHFLCSSDRACVVRLGDQVRRRSAPHRRAARCCGRRRPHRHRRTLPYTEIPAMLPGSITAATWSMSDWSTKADDKPHSRSSGASECSTSAASISTSVPSASLPMNRAWGARTIHGRRAPSTPEAPLTVTCLYSHSTTRMMIGSRPVSPKVHTPSHLLGARAGSRTQHYCRRVSRPKATSTRTTVQSMRVLDDQNRLATWRATRRDDPLAHLLSADSTFASPWPIDQRTPRRPITACGLAEPESQYPTRSGASDRPPRAAAKGLAPHRNRFRTGGRCASQGGAAKRTSRRVRCSRRSPMIL